MVYTKVMPVKKESENDGEAKFIINNGDLQALNRIRDEYNLRDSDDVITFAIGVLSQSKGRSVSIQQDDGSVIKLLPSDQIKKQADGSDTPA